jgi:hypothetical protein
MQKTNMKRQRPWEVTFLGGLFIAVGVVSAIAHARNAPLDRGLALLELVQVWAIVGGIFLLRGHNWARWAMIVWVVFHVAVGLMHSSWMGISHALLAAAIVYALLRPSSAEFFAPQAKANQAL